MHRILALLMANLMFTSSVSFSLDMHLCQGNIKSISLFGKAKSCCAKENRNQCNKRQNQCDYNSGQYQSWAQKPCCTNNTIVFQSLTYQADQNLPGDERPIAPNLCNSIAFDAFKPHKLSSHSFRNFHPHKPPLPEQDLRILFQSFLN
jgi:hypothetical protein